MKLVFRIILSFFLASCIVVVVWINWNLNPASRVTTGSIVKQLNFLSRELQDGADAKMQEIYPEGYVFMNSLYALAWCDVLEHTKDEALHKEGSREINHALDRIQSQKGKVVFDVDLSIPYGAFYTGWSTYVLGRKLDLIGSAHEDELTLFRRNCDSIATVIQRQIYPESYWHDAWPADGMVCVSALALHDRIFSPKYASIRRDWVNRVKANLDSRGLIPHSAMTSGKTAEGARGASQCLMLGFLQEIDPVFGREQFDIFENHFLDSRFGLPGIREYPKGVYGMGDIDSGPVILGMGGAASIVGIRTLASFDHEKCFDLQSGIEAFAFPIETETDKNYLFGQLPMADAFLAWSQTSLLGKTPKHSDMPWKFRTYSILLCMVMGVTIFWIWRRRRI